MENLKRSLRGINLSKKFIVLILCFATITLKGDQLRDKNQDITTSSLAYAYIYNITMQTIKPGEDIPFDSNGIMTPNIYHTKGDTKIVLSNAGTYLINFFTQGVPGNAFTLFLNNMPVPGGSYEPYPVGNATGAESGQIIINVKAGDVITLRHHSPAIGQGNAFLRAASREGKPSSVNASLVILQIA